MILREMLVDDLDQVMEIEQDLFHVPWTKEGFFTFLTRDDAMFLTPSFTPYDVKLGVFSLFKFSVLFRLSYKPQNEMKY